MVALTGGFDGTRRFVTVQEGATSAQVLADVGEAPVTQFQAFDDVALYLQQNDDATELWAVDADGARVLSSPLTPGGDVSSWERQGDLVLYVADGTTNEEQDAYVVPVDGGGARLLTASVVGVRAASLTTDASHAIIRPDDQSLISVDTTTGDVVTLETRQTEGFVTGADDVVYHLVLSIIDAPYVTIREDGTGARTRRPSGFDPTINSAIEITQIVDDQVVAVFNGDGGHSAWRFPLRAAGAPARLSPTYPNDPFFPDQAVVVDDRVIVRFALRGKVFSSPVSTPNPADTVELTPAFEEQGSRFLTTTPDGRVLFTSDTVEGFRAAVPRRPGRRVDPGPHPDRCARRGRDRGRS